MKKTELTNTLDFNYFLMHVILNETKWNEEFLLFMRFFLRQKSKIRHSQ